jgi:hypothetical protein
VLMVPRSFTVPRYAFKSIVVKERSLLPTPLVRCLVEFKEVCKYLVWYAESKRPLKLIWNSSVFSLSKRCWS